MRWKSMLGMAAGAAAAYLFDPVSGRGRRARLSDQAKSKMRSAADEASRRARYEMGRVRGALHEVGNREDPPATDKDLLQKIRSEALGPAQGDLDHVDIRVSDGVVILLGPSVDQAAERKLVEKISDITGVKRVDNELARV